MNKKKVMFVFGTRPEAIKMAPVIKECGKYQDFLEILVVVTGQHRQMLDQVLRLFEIDPDYDLGIMEANQTLTSIVTKTLKGTEEIILNERPDLILVQGDTSTAFAAGLSAFYYKVPLGHIEAGLRTFDKWQPYPEEINRKLLTSLADLHFPPTKSAMDNLLREQVPREEISLTGNTVIDALLEVAKRDFNLASIGIRLTPGKKIVLVTTHRRENWGAPLRGICTAIKIIAERFHEQVEIVLPVHKNPTVSNVVNEILGKVSNVLLTEPLDYEPFIHLLKASYLVLTDSGGVQEEAPSLGKPVLVMRDKTERPEAVLAGTVKLVGADTDMIVAEASKLLGDEAEYAKMSQAANPYGDGRASSRIIYSILHYFGMADNGPEEFNA
ncbi:MAG: UDP-N-acetylglucosamine 2-epimerase (non-hydrolyzing) [Candidatus Margulisiibacteriota bacterium]|jgi:UDP-N-acetylglucosamine 2-epimerase (non-hydrolysing)